MKNNYIFIIFLLFVFYKVHTAEAANDQINNKIDQSRAVAMEFMTALKGELKKALSEGGVVNAINVCNLKTPEISRSVSVKHGMSVARTSLKVRNQNNAPDAWEKKVLELFEKEKAGGKNIKALEHVEVVNVNGKEVFRYMKVIPTNAICLRCHGAKLNPTVTEAINKHYPEDKATGFTVGDIRGAFTISQPLQ